jgi:acetolactate decarboxylase
MITLFNANTRSAYQAGYYDGAFTIGDLLAKGDFGLGALARNDGELVVLDGVAWRTTENGTTTRLGADDGTPYATVLPFRAERALEVTGALGKDAFEAFVARSVPLANRIWALRIRGRLAFVEAGASGPQSQPYRPLAEVFATYTMHRHEDVDGTLVAFACPDFLHGVDFVGFHYHLLSDDCEHGGHVVDFEIVAGTVELCEATAYRVALPGDVAFHALSLGPFHGCS